MNPVRTRWISGVLQSAACRRAILPIMFASSLFIPSLAFAESGNVHAAQAFQRYMEAEKASTRAIQDSLKFVNKTHWDFSTPSGGYAASKEQTPVARPDPQDQLRRYMALQDASKIRLLRDLASSGDVAAMAELGAAMLNHAYGLDSTVEQALQMLSRAADAGDGSAAFNAGLAEQRLGHPAAALAWFEQAMKAGVAGADHQAMLSAVDLRDYGRMSLYGKQAAAHGNAMAAYVVCIVALEQKDGSAGAEYCPRAYDLGFHEAAGDAGIALANRGEWERAWPYVLACASGEGKADCKRNAGIVAHQTFRHDESIRWLEAARRMGDKDPTGRMVLAREWLMAEQKPWDMIETVLTGLLEEAGFAAQAHFYLAVTYELRPDRTYSDQDINSHLIAAARGGYPDAREALRKAGISWE